MDPYEESDTTISSLDDKQEEGSSQEQVQLSFPVPSIFKGDHLHQSINSSSGRFQAPLTPTQPYSSPIPGQWRPRMFNSNNNNSSSTNSNSQAQQMAPRSADPPVFSTPTMNGFDLEAVIAAVESNPNLSNNLKDIVKTVKNKESPSKNLPERPKNWEELMSELIQLIEKECKNRSDTREIDKNLKKLEEELKEYESKKRIYNNLVNRRNELNRSENEIQIKKVEVQREMRQLAISGGIKIAKNSFGDALDDGLGPSVSSLLKTKPSIIKKKRLASNIQNAEASSNKKTKVTPARAVKRLCQEVNAQNTPAAQSSPAAVTFGVKSSRPAPRSIATKRTISKTSVLAPKSKSINRPNASIESVDEGDVHVRSTDKKKKKDESTNSDEKNDSMIGFEENEVPGNDGGKDKDDEESDVSDSDVFDELKTVKKEKEEEKEKEGIPSPIKFDVKKENDEDEDDQKEKFNVKIEKVDHPSITSFSSVSDQTKDTENQNTPVDKSFKRIPPSSSSSLSSVKNPKNHSKYSISSFKAGLGPKSNSCVLVLKLSGNHLYVSLGGASVKRFNIQDSSKIVKYDGHKKKVRTLIIWEEKHLLITGCEDGFIRVFNTDREVPIKSLDLQSGINCLDNQFPYVFAGLMNGQIVRINLELDNLNLTTKKFSEKGIVQVKIVSENILLVGSGDNKMFLVQFTTGLKTKTIDEVYFPPILFEMYSETMIVSYVRGSTTAAMEKNSSVCWYNTKDWKIERQINFDYMVNNIEYTDYDLFVSSLNGEIRSFNLESRELNWITYYSDKITALEVNNEKVIVGTYGGLVDTINYCDPVIVVCSFCKLKFLQEPDLKVHIKQAHKSSATTT